MNMADASTAPGPVSSMTGFAQASGKAGGLDITVVLKSVNHRFLDLRWQTPAEWEGLSTVLEPRLRARLRRGHVTVRVAATAGVPAGTTATPALSWDRERVAAYARAYAEIGAQLGSAVPLSPTEVLRFPGVLASPAPGLPLEPPLTAIEAVLEAAAERLVRMRATEGGALAADVLSRCGLLERRQRELRTCLAEVGDALFVRLRQRLEAWLAPAGVAVAPERLLQEVALLAERADVSEELTRIEAHCGQLRQLLAAGGEIGKKLDFLAQEMHREVNTLLSKTGAGGDAALRMTAIGLEWKAEIEKIREQAQNLE